MIGRKAMLLAAPAVLCGSLFLGAPDASAHAARTSSAEPQTTRFIHASRYIHTARYVHTARYIRATSVTPSDSSV